MPITVTCDECSEPHRVRDDAVGKQFVCKGCGKSRSQSKLRPMAARTFPASMLPSRSVNLLTRQEKLISICTAS